MKKNEKLKATALGNSTFRSISETGNLGLSGVQNIPGGSSSINARTASINENPRAIIWNNTQFMLVALPWSIGITYLPQCGDVTIVNQGGFGMTWEVYNLISPLNEVLLYSNFLYPGGFDQYGAATFDRIIRIYNYSNFVAVATVTAVY